jgi:hypothetical protein
MLLNTVNRVALLIVIKESINQINLLSWETYFMS